MNYKRLALLLVLLGTLNSSAFAAQFTFNSINLAIPDGSPVGVSNTQTLGPGLGAIADLNVTLEISGNYNGDLYVTLVHGSGFSVLLNRTGRTAADSFGYGDTGFDVTLDDQASNGDIHNYQLALGSAPSGALGGIWAPDARDVNPATTLDTHSRTALLSSFNGLDASGDWTIFLADMESVGTSTLVSWGLEIEQVPDNVNTALLFSVGLVGLFAVGIVRRNS